MRSLSLVWSFLFGISLCLNSSRIVFASHPLENLSPASQLLTQSAIDAEEAKARQLVEEAQKLTELGTGEGKRQAIEKYLEARAIWQKLGNKGEEANILLSIGTLYYIQSDNKNALKYFQEGLTVTEQNNNRIGTAFFLYSLGNVYSNIGEKQKAIESYNRSLTTFQEVGELGYEADISVSLGAVYSSLGQIEKAIESYNKALAIYEKNNDIDNIASTLNSLGLIYSNNGETQKALEALNRALTIQQKAKNAYGEANILSSLSLVYTATGNSSKALEALQQALKIYQSQQGNLSGVELAFNLTYQAVTLTGLGSVYFGANEYNKAIESFTQARSLFEKTGQSGFVADVLYNLNFVYTTIGENQKALDALDEAIGIYYQNGDPAKEAQALSQQGEIYNDIGEPQQAIDLHYRALPLARKAGDREKEATILSDLAEVYSSLGDYQQAIELELQSLQIATSIGNITKKGQSSNNIATNYRYLKDYPKALEYYNQALTIWRGNNDLLNLISSLTGIVRVYEAQKDFDRGFPAANEIVTKSREGQNLFGEASGYSMLGRLYNAKGDYAKGLENSQKAREIFVKLGFSLAEINVLDNISLAYHKLGQTDKAIAIGKEEIQLQQKLGDLAGQAETHYNIALIERDRNNLNAALEEIQTSIAIVEDFRTKVNDRDLQISYFESVQRYYEFYIDLLMELDRQQPDKNYDALALQVSERARARVLLEILTLANADITSGIDAASLKQQESLQQKIQAAQKRLNDLSSSNAEAEQINITNSELNSLSQQYKALQAKIRTDNPRYAALTQPEPIDLQQIQQQVLDKDTVLLQYSLGAERSYLWLVTQDSITSYQLPDRNSIETAVDSYRQELINPTYKLNGNSKAGDALSRILIEPVASQIAGKRLLIVADGKLQNLPFAGLPVKDSNNQIVPLLVQNEIVTSPSTSTLAILRRDLQNRKSASKTLAIFADPVFNNDDPRLQTRINQGQPTMAQSLSRDNLDRSIRDIGANLDRLPGTRTEAQDILKLLPAGEVFQAFDFDANLAKVTEPQISQYRIIHFATHGLINNENPELSGIVLSLVDPQGNTKDGFLQLEKIYNLNLPAELVVLSACETGLGEEYQGEGIVGLTRGFMYAGTPRIVVSLWSVDDNATADLMTKFYQGMLQQDLTPAAALRQAQLAIWKEKKWEAPFFWAAFTLQGEWR